MVPHRPFYKAMNYPLKTQVYRLSDYSGSYGGGDGGQELFAVDWLGDVFLRALAQAPGAIGVAGFCGNKDDGDMPGRFVTPEISLDLVAAHAGHDDIHQD